MSTSVSLPSGGHNAITYADSAHIDAFSRLRVSPPNVLLSSVMDYDKRPLMWDEVVSGGGVATFIPNERSVSLGVGTASGDEVVRQTKQYFTYRAGQSQIVLMTFVFGTGKAGLRQRAGYFDSENGLFFECDDVTMSVNIRSFVSGAPVTTKIAQSNWNKDTLDGSGDANNPSGINLVLTDAQILIMDYQWLGVGRVRFGFDLGGEILYVHEENNANVITSVYMTTGSLPCRYEITNTAITASASTLKQVCSSVLREGAEAEPGIERTTDTAITPYSATTALTSILGIRIKSSFIRASISPLSVDVLVTGGNAVRWLLLLNPTITGTPTWASIMGASVAEKSISNLPASMGTCISSGYIGGTSGGRGSVAARSLSEALVLGATIAGVSDELWLCVQSLSATSDTSAALGFREIR